jgi:hypothetical protein
LSSRRAGLDLTRRPETTLRLLWILLSLLVAVVLLWSC